MSDEYLTIERNGTSFFKDKGSKFYGYAYPLTDETEIKPIIQLLKKEHPTAGHFCYAFVLGAARDSYRGSDAGEPNGTAGPPILGQINSKGLTNILVVVARQFGGTKLGVSGLINAYKTTSKQAIANTRIIKKTVDDYFVISFEYPQMKVVMNVLNNKFISIEKQEFELDCKVHFHISKSLSAPVVSQLKKIDGTDLTFLGTK